MSNKLISSLVFALATTFGANVALADNQVKAEGANTEGKMEQKSEVKVENKADAKGAKKKKVTKETKETKGTDGAETKTETKTETKSATDTK